MASTDNKMATTDNKMASTDNTCGGTIWERNKRNFQIAKWGDFYTTKDLHISFVWNPQRDENLMREMILVLLMGSDKMKLN